MTNSKMSITKFLVWICVGLICFHQNIEAIMVDNDVFEPISMGDISKMVLRVSFDETTDEQDHWNPNHVVVLTFNLTIQDSWVFEIMNDSLTFNYDQIRKRKTQELSIRGINIGIDTLHIYGHIVDLSIDHLNNHVNTSEIFPPILITENEEQKEVEEVKDENDKETDDETTEDEEISHQVELSEDHRVLMKNIKMFVVVKSRFLPNLFTIVLTIMVVINVVNFGAGLDLKVIKEVFKRPIGPAVGFMSQFVLMPLFSFGVGYVLLDDKLFRLGLFVLGCCPGGNASNFWCLLLGGDVNLSITMTFISTCAALGMMPFWMAIGGPYLTEGEIQIPYVQLVLGLVFLIAPLSLGMWIRFRFIKLAQFMQRIVVYFTLVIVAFIFTAGIYINLYIFRLIDINMIIAGFLVVGAGYFFGGILAYLFRLKRPQITAVAIETAFQNGQIAFVLLRVSLPEPYGELATAAPVAQLCLTGLPLWGVLICWKTYSKFIKPRCMKKEEIEPLREEGKITDDLSEVGDGKKVDFITPTLNEDNEKEKQSNDLEEGKPFLESDFFKSKETQFIDKLD